MGDEDPWAEYTRPEMAERDAAVTLLATALSRGQLLLLLGAGISKPLGLPNWKELVDSAAATVDIDSTTLLAATGGDLLDAMDQIRDACPGPSRFLEVVSEALYRDMTAYPDTIVHEPTLNAIGALVMASARGSVAEVINLNFDDVLEWYLHLHGFTTQVVHTPPTLVQGRADVAVFHPHGFLPLDSRASSASAVVLTKDEYRKRLSEEASTPWNAFLLSRLHSKILLSVGTSMSDIDIGVSLDKAQTFVGDIRPLGFVVGRHESAATTGLFKQGLVPVTVSEYSEVPDFLLDIAREAARMYRHP
jgi:hypothetical protein